MSTRKEAIERIAAAGDWGWKGGKPGELTAGEFLRIYDNAMQRGPTPEYYDAMRQFKTQLEAAWKKNPRALGGKENTIDVYDSRIIGRIGQRDRELEEQRAWYKGMRDIAQDLSFLENSGIPRKWTGKIATAIPPRDWGTLPAFQEFYPQTVRNSGMVMAAATRKLSELMRDMSDDARQIFLDLLPTATQPLEDVARAARNQAKLSRLQRPRTSR